MAETKATLRIRSVESDADADAVRSELEAIDGVMGASIDGDGDAEVRFDQDLLAEERLERAVEELGHDVA